MQGYHIYQWHIQNYPDNIAVYEENRGDQVRLIWEDIGIGEVTTPTPTIK